MDSLKQMKVWVAELLDDEAIAALEEVCRVDIKYKVPREEQLAMIKDYHAVIIRSETVVDKEFLDAAVNLKIVGRGAPDWITSTSTTPPTEASSSAIRRKAISCRPVSRRGR